MRWDISLQQRNAIADMLVLCSCKLIHFSSFCFVLAFVIVVVVVDFKLENKTS